MSVSYLADVAASLLAAAEAALVQTTTGTPAPGHAYRVHGTPVADFDCDGGQLTVHLVTVRHEGERQSCQIVARATWQITLLRCSSPEVDDDVIDADAAALLVDAWAILTECYDRLANETLIPGEVDCEDIELGELTPVEIEGQLGGWAFPVTVSLNGAGPSGS